MPGPDPTPEPPLFKQLRAWLVVLAATVVLLLGVIAYLLYR
jgi:hypothetical protein